MLKSLKGRDRSEDLGVDGIILKCILGKEGGCGLDSSGLGWGPVAGCFENGNELLSATKSWEFIAWLIEGLDERGPRVRFPA
jgi:hypothetical protein